MKLRSFSQNKLIIFFAVASVGLSLSSCSLLKARAAKEQVFVPKVELLSENRERAPFHGYWVYDSEEYFQLRKRVGKVKISEIDISAVEKLYNEARGSKKSKERRIEEAGNLARYLEGKLKLLFQDREFSPIIEVVSADEATAGKKDPLILNLSLTSVIPTKPEVNFVGTVAGYFVPGGGLISYFGQGSVAMEGYVSGSEDPMIYEQYADREGQKVSPFTLKDYQRYAHIRVVLDDWAMQIVRLLNTAGDVEVEDSLPVSINPL